MTKRDFLFTLEAWAELEDAGIRLEDLQDILNGTKGNRIRSVITIARVLGNAYNRENGIDTVLTDEQLTRDIKPNEIVQLQIDLMNAIGEGMKMETDEDVEHDVVLEEIQRKKKKTV